MGVLPINEEYMVLREDFMNKLMSFLLSGNTQFLFLVPRMQKFKNICQQKWKIWRFADKAFVWGGVVKPSAPHCQNGPGSKENRNILQKHEDPFNNFWLTVNELIIDTTSWRKYIKSLENNKEHYSKY